jgi:hypothetical protein
MYYAYKMNDSPINRTNTIKDSGVQLNSKLYFHAHVGCKFSKYVRLLGLIEP